MKINEGDSVAYITGTPRNPHIVMARVFRKCGGKLWLDHYTFSRARVVSENSERLTGSVEVAR